MSSRGRIGALKKLDSPYKHILTGVAPDFSLRDWLLIQACIQLVIKLDEMKELPFSIETIDELKETLRKVNEKCKQEHISRCKRLDL
jgi:hypothetical protein